MNTRDIRVTDETAKHSLSGLTAAAGIVALGLFLLVVLF